MSQNFERQNQDGLFLASDFFNVGPVRGFSRVCPMLSTLPQKQEYQISALMRPIYRTALSNMSLLQEAVS